MPLQLPPSYTASTKNDCVAAVIGAMDEEVLARKQAIAADDDYNYLSSLQRSYHYAGFGCALSVVSTTNLSQEIIEKLNEKTYNIIRLQYGVRGRILGVPAFDKAGEPVSKVRLQNLGKRVNSADLAGWDSQESRQILIATILSQIEKDISTLSNVEKIVEDNRPKSKEFLADVTSQMLLTSFMLGFIDGIMFARGDADFKVMEAKIKSEDNREWDVLSFIGYSSEEFNRLDAPRLISRIMPRKGSAEPPATKTKPEKTKPIIKKPAEKISQEETAMGRYFKASFR